MLLEAWVTVMLLAELAALASTARFLLRSARRATLLSAKRQGSIRQPSVSVLVPCKGPEPGLAANARAIISQDYPKAEYLFIIDSKKDSAWPVLQRLRGRRVRILLTEPAPGYAGKIAALRTGVRHARGSVFVFADADIRPSARWLSALVAPLAERAIATTGYRWYIPAGGFAACLRSAWDAKGLGVQFSRRYSFFWGGSGALRRRDFQRLRILQRWRGEFSDDSALTLALRSRGAQPFFVPAAVSPSLTANSPRELVEWSNRQIWLTRLYNRTAWKHAIVAYGFFVLVALTGIALLLDGAADPRFAPAGFLLLALPLALRAARHRELQKAYQRLLPEHAALRRFQWRVALCSALVPFLLLYNLLRAPTLQGIRWRGSTYRAPANRRE